MPLLSYLPQRYRALGMLSRNGKNFGALHETGSAFPGILPKTKPLSRARKGQGRAVKRDGLIFFVGFHGVEPLQEAVLHTLRLVAGHGIQRNAVDAAENAVLNVGVIPL